MGIESKIRDFIVKNLHYAEDNPIADDDSFLETGVVDSMGVMELVAFIQFEFGVEVAQHEIVVENIDSIGKLANFVRRKPQPKAQRASVADTTSLAGAPSLASQ